MPILDGYDVLRELKTNPELSRLPVIILSILEDKEKGLQLGANAYLNKPLEKEQLLAKISEILEKEEKKILLVDDDESFVKATRFFLKKNGYDVYVAFNGEDALKVCQERKPDLVILDILMPEKDGMETLKALKKDSLLQKIPVIMMTVNALENGRTKCLSLGADQYLTKKEGLDFLLEKIREILKDKNQKL
jgi:DNA-binding response OmpR family regulator